MTSVGKLETVFVNIIQDIMAAERQPLVRLQQRRDQINVQKAIYTDLRGIIDDLHNAVKSLTSSDVFYSLTAGRKVTVSGIASGSTVVGASASSSAVPGSYEMAITSLAREQRVRSTQHTGGPLGLSGMFNINGAQIEAAESDQLTDIAYKINQAVYADGQQVRASIIDNHLVLSHSRTGASATFNAQDEGEGSVLQSLGILNAQGGFRNVLQNAGNAVFSVNGMTVTRESNSGLTDVVSGLTINLGADGEGKSAVLQVSSDGSSERATINNFLQKFNQLTSYLGDKTATTKQSDGTYKRGSLAGETVFSSLRLDLIRTFNASVANSGSLKWLNEIGLSMNDSFQASIRDASKLESALANNRQDVTRLLDGLMNKLDTSLSRYTGSSGIMQSMAQSLDMQFQSTKTRIDTLSTRLTAREEALYKQFGEVQAQLISMSYMSSQLNSVYGSFNRNG